MKKNIYLLLFIINAFIFSLKVFSMEQRIADFEISIDAPWRMEPRLKPLANCNLGSSCGSGSSYNYGAIPVNITILDAIFPNKDVENSFFIQRALQGVERDDFSLGDIIIEIINPTDNELLSGYPNMNLKSFNLLTIYEEINGTFVKQ